MPVGRRARPATDALITYIDQHKAEFGVEPICAALTSADTKIAPSTYYAAKQRPPSARAVRDSQLKIEIARRQRPYASIQAAATLPTRSRREVTVYACTECEQRYLGQQWCEDCNRPCTRLALGGLTPCCEEPLTSDELLDRNTLTADSRQNSPSTKPGA